MLIEIIVAAVLVMVASLSGVIFVHRFTKTFLEDRLSYLVSFSAGVFLITAGALALEVFEIIEVTFGAALLIGTGYALAWGLHTVLPETHHHHDPSCHRLHGGARKLIVGDSIHNVADGVVLVAAFTASTTLGFAVTLSILIHEVLQEISEFFVLRQAGYSTKRALAINFLVSSTILVGVGLGYFALATHELEGVLLAVSAGFFLHVVVHDLLPKRSHHETARQFSWHVVLVVIGMFLMGTIAVSLGDSHAHGDEEHDHADESGFDILHDEHGHETGHDHEYETIPPVVQ